MSRLVLGFRADRALRNGRLAHHAAMLIERGLSDITVETRTTVVRDPLFMAESDVPPGQYYAGQDEGQRLFRFRHNRLELLRTRELLVRQLPSPPAVVLDVGGGTGVHAAWLAGRGYRVHLVDVVAEHVRAAAEHRLLTAEVGDARRLTQADTSVDAVLLLGPLYHFVGRAERIAALVEARRVLRPGGVLLAAAIGRFMAVLDWAQRGGLTADIAAKLVASAVQRRARPHPRVHRRLLPHRRPAAAGGRKGRVRRRTRGGD